MRRVLIFAGVGASVDPNTLLSRQPTIWSDENCSAVAWRLAHEQNDVRQIMHIHNFHKGMQQVIKASQPDQFHKYVAELSKNAYYDVTVVTTNVDDFFERAGVSPSRIIHLHGSTLRRRCPSCQYRYFDGTDHWQTPDQIERCPKAKCRSPLAKTDVMFYGEQSPGYLAGIQAFNRLEVGDTAVMVGSSGETFGVAQRLWERCRSRRVDTIHISPSMDQHYRFPANVALHDTVARALPELELHFRIQRTVEDVVQE